MVSRFPRPAPPGPRPSHRGRGRRAPPWRSAPGWPARSSLPAALPAVHAVSLAPARSGGQALVHAGHARAVEARHVIRRRHRLLVEERGQLVVLLREARPAVELRLEPERLAAQRLAEVLPERRAVRGGGGG